MGGTCSTERNERKSITRIIRKTWTAETNLGPSGLRTWDDMFKLIFDK